jgi:hypothetical protein
VKGKGEENEIKGNKKNTTVNNNNDDDHNNNNKPLVPDTVDPERVV